MAKTKELVIICGEARIVPNRYNQVVCHIDDPDVNDSLLSYHSDDLIQFVNNNYGLEEVYSKEELEKWATENGYTKEQENVTSK